MWVGLGHSETKNNFIDRGLNNGSSASLSVRTTHRLAHRDRGCFSVTVKLWVERTHRKFKPLFRLWVNPTHRKRSKNAKKYRNSYFNP